MCSECGIRKCYSTGRKKDGSPRYRKKCHRCAGRTRNLLSVKQRKYYSSYLRKLELMQCEECGFKAEHPCQLDVDHIDGNKENNDLTNHKILCSNCHRLKTVKNNDHLNWWLDQE
jgi:hypothetical protein